MSKKNIIILLVILAIVALLVIGYQKGFLFKGAGKYGAEKSIMSLSAQQGGQTMTENEWIANCEKSDKDSQDECFGMGAFYYRDAIFCKYIKNSDISSECTKEKIEEAYKQFGDAGKTATSGIPGTGTLGAFPFLNGGTTGSFIPTTPAGDTTDSSGTNTEGNTSATSSVKITDDMCVEILAYTYRGMELYSAGNMLAMSQIGQQLELLEKQYGIDTGSDAFTEACTSKIMSDVFIKKVHERMRELGSTVKD